MQWLLYAVLIYLGVCYLGGLYLVVRLTMGMRLRRALAKAIEWGAGRYVEPSQVVTATTSTSFAGHHAPSGPAADTRTASTAETTSRQAA